MAQDPQVKKQNEFLLYLREKNPQLSSATDEELSAYIRERKPELVRYLDEIPQPVQQERPLYRRITEAATQPQQLYSQGIRQVAKGNIPAGAMNVMSAGLSAPFAPINVASELLGEVPLVGPTMKEGLQGLASIPPGIFNLLRGGVQGGLNALGFTPESERQLLGQNPQQYRETQQASQTIGDVGSYYGVPQVMAPVLKSTLQAKNIGKAFQKITPSPEGVYGRGAGLGALDPLDRAAAERGVRERIEMGGRYKTLPQRFEKLQSTKKQIFERQINPEIQKMADSGLSVASRDIAERAVADLNKRFPDLKAPDAARFRTELENLKEGFIKNNSETLNPKQMQEMKTAVHQRAPMDEMSGLRNEFNKTIAYELRKSLEQWNPRLRPLHKRWAELNRLSQSMEEVGQKEGRISSSPLSSAPFYMAVGEPVRGAILAEARNVARSPRIRSKIAFMLDYLQHVGDPRTPEFLPPPFVADIGGTIPPSARSQIVKQLGGPDKQTRFGPLKSVSDIDLITLAKEAGLYENAPLSEAPVSRGGSMDIRGPANEEQIRRRK